MVHLVHVGTDFTSFRFFLYLKISHTCRRSSFIAKRHARLACSLVNALTTAYLCRYHLFTSKAPYGAGLYL